MPYSATFKKAHLCMAKEKKSSCTVVQHNDLNIAHYKLTLNEQRLIFQAVSTLNPLRHGVVPGFSQVDKIRITATEFGETWGISEKDRYKSLRDATNELYERSIVEIFGKRKCKTRWVWKVQYHDKEGWAELSFTPDVVPFLTALSGKTHTSFQLGQIAGVKNTYAMRLFAWCAQYSDTGWLLVSVDDLVKRLGLNYVRFTDIRRYVIEPAITELNTKSDMVLTWEPVKRGRTVAAVRFEFSKRDGVEEKGVVSENGKNRTLRERSAFREGATR